MQSQHPKGGCFMGKIATRAFCNMLRPNAFSSDLTKCPIKSEILSVGLKVNGNYTDTQLVMEEDIKNLVSVIVVGANGYIDKIEV